jgi:small multidrug resistance pump
MFTAWALLMSAIGIEVAATASLARTQGFRDPVWTAVVIAGYAASIWLLAIVTKHIPVSISYAVWSGLGTAGIAAVGVMFLGERLDLLKTSALLLIIVGVVVLNLGSTTAH